MVTRPSLKLALVAPFEGRYREVGYEVIYAIRLAVREANESEGVAGYSVELLSLDDGGDPAQAVVQARKVGTDPQVLAVIGHWLDDTTLAAAPVFAEQGTPLLATTSSADLPDPVFRLWPADAAIKTAAPEALHCPDPCDSLEDLEWLFSQTQLATDRPPLAGPPLWGQSQFYRLAGPAAEGVFFVAPAPLPADSTDPGFAKRYRAISNGVEPGTFAVLAYDATRLLFDAVVRDVEANGKPSRAGVAAALASADYAGLSGKISFDSDRDWVEAKGWVYQWQEGKVVKP